MRVVVIGAGPAGCMAAITAASLGAAVTLVDGNEKIGRKLYISGKGRCNVTNAADFNEFIEKIVRNPKFVYGALRGFSNADTQKFFTSRGVPLKTERGGRVFPASDKAADIVDALFNELKRSGVCLKTGVKADKFITDQGKISAIATSKGLIYGDAFILATGGKSYPGTGADGSGYAIARAVGHTVVEPKPALSAFIVDKVKTPFGSYPVSECGLPVGVSLKNIALTACYDGKRRSEFGEALFTDDGISGPVALTLSSYVNRAEKVVLSLDMKPALDEKTLDLRLQREFVSNKRLKNILPDLLPQSVANWYARLLPYSEKAVNSVTKEERKNLIKMLKGMEFAVSLKPIEEAIVTSGGIKTNEIDPKTMRSKTISNLYFAGEIIDVDALTGGYNIQIALSTGYAAGKNAANAANAANTDDTEKTN